jgi:hypothetical protein
MTQTSKQELLSGVKARYAKAELEGKIKILDEFCHNTGYNRKYAIRILQTGHHYKARKKTGVKKYLGQSFQIILKIWELLNYPCGARLKPQLLPMSEQLASHKEIPELNEVVKGQLLEIGSATLDRYLIREKKIRKLHRGRSTTRHGSLLKSSVPIRITNWNTRRIGFMEMDTVAHCGDVLSGEFIYSLDMVEIASGWSEQIAVMGKSEAGVVKAIEEVKQGLPFELLGLDSDTGSEFVNWHMVRWCKDNNLSFTRSRPYYKNDNAYVEQKNYTHIRKWLGYRRYDNKRQLELINDLYRNELRLFNNFFLPVMKIKRKEKVNNSVCKKIYDNAQTPYQRLQQSKQIPLKAKQQLRQLYETLNPVKLKTAIALKLKRILQS